MSRRAARAASVRPPRAAAPAGPPRASRPAGASRAPAWAASLVIALTWAAMFAPQLFAARVFALGDAGQYTAFADFSRERWQQHHERTHWNPYVFLGIPASASLADPRPQWLPGPLLGAWDAITRAAPLGAPLVSSLAGAIANAWLARALWGCGAFAMTLAGLLWLLAPGLVVPLAFGHDNQAVTVGLIPVAALAALRTVGSPATRGALGWALALAFTLASQVVGGHPQFVVLSLAFVTPLAVAVALRAQRPRRLALALGAALLAAAMAAAVWLPALLYGTHTLRAVGGFAVRTSLEWSIRAGDLLALAWPHAVGFGGAAYWGGLRATDFSHSLGMVGALLACAGLLAGGSARGMAWTLGATGAAAAMLAFGSRLPVVGEAFQRIPPFNIFRTPVGWLLIVQLAGALLAARGLDGLFARRTIAPLVAGGIACAAIAALLALAPGPWAAVWESVGARPAGSLAAIRHLALGLGGVALALGAAALAAHRVSARWSGVLPGLPVAAAAAGLLVLVVPVLRASGGSRDALRSPAPTALARAAAETPLYRAHPSDRAGWFSNSWVAWRARQPAGLHGAVPLYWEQAFRKRLLMDDDFVRGCAVRFTTAHPAARPDSVRFVPRADGVYERLTPLPRAYAAGRTVGLPGLDALKTAVWDTAWEPEVTAYVAGAGEKLYPGSADAVIAWERDDPDHLELRVSAAAEAFVVIADAFFPGWTATLDGVRLPIVRVNHVLRGVAIPAGEHRLEMRYVPEGWEAGLALSRTAWVAFLLLCAALAVGGVRGRSPVRSTA